jgi:hypothetical protein
MVGQAVALANSRDCAVPAAYNRALRQPRAPTMEAEQLNQIETTLAALRDREAQLRRYL